MKLALHQVTALDVTPLQLIGLAADTGCSEVCLFTHTPRLPTPDGDVDLGFPSVSKASLRETRASLAARGVAVANVEFFPLDRSPPWTAFRDALELGAQLGARMAVAHLHDEEASRAVETLARFAALAHEHGLLAGLEFMPLSPACPSLAVAVERIVASGSPHVRLGIDALHLMRSGGTVQQVASIDPDLIGYFQICDGPLGIAVDYLEEALDRQVAGRGSFPLRDLAQALPAHTMFDVETPLGSLMSQGVPPKERVSMAVAGARWMLAERTV